MWLAKGNATIGELSARDSSRKVRDLYEAGAVEVIAILIEDIPGTNERTTNHLMARAPGDPESRARLFAYERAHAESEGSDGEEDRGQEYLYFKCC